MRSKLSGIYQITSPSGRRYIGSAKDTSKRKREHFTALARGDHSNRLLQRAYTKHVALSFSVLLVCRESDLFYYEQILIDGLAPAYNLSPTASGSRGLKWSEESKARIRGKRSRDGDKISAGMMASSTQAERSERGKYARSKWTVASKALQVAKLTGRKDDAETKIKKSKALIGRPVSQETREKLASQKGWKHSAEARAKMRAAALMRGGRLGYRGETAESRPPR